MRILNNYLSHDWGFDSNQLQECNNCTPVIKWTANALLADGTAVVTRPPADFLQNPATSSTIAAAKTYVETNLRYQGNVIPPVSTSDDTTGCLAKIKDNISRDWAFNTNDFTECNTCYPKYTYNPVGLSASDGTRGAPYSATTDAKMFVVTENMLCGGHHVTFPSPPPPGSGSPPPPPVCTSITPGIYTNSSNQIIIYVQTHGSRKIGSVTTNFTIIKTGATYFFAFSTTSRIPYTVTCNSLTDDQGVAYTLGPNAANIVSGRTYRGTEASNAECIRTDGEPCTSTNELTVTGEINATYIFNNTTGWYIREMTGSYAIGLSNPVSETGFTYTVSGNTISTSNGKTIIFNQVDGSISIDGATLT
jgi:hypothetical protein